MKLPNRWMNWMGFGLGAIALVITDPSGNKYLIALMVGLVALLGNAIALLRKQAPAANR